MNDPYNASGRLVNTLKVLRVIYAVLLVPLVFFSLFGLFIFIVAITEKSLRDWIYFFHHLLLLTSMVAAIISTGSMIRRGNQKTALILYLVPIALIAGLVIYGSLQ
jgi:ABC-type multidrug transport system permease subunit